MLITSHRSFGGADPMYANGHAFMPDSGAMSDSFGIDFSQQDSLFGFLNAQ